MTFAVPVGTERESTGPIGGKRSNALHKGCDRTAITPQYVCHEKAAGSSPDLHAPPAEAAGTVGHSGGVRTLPQVEEGCKIFFLPVLFCSRTETRKYVDL